VLAFTRVDAEYPDGLERTDDAYPEADHVGDWSNGDWHGRFAQHPAHPLRHRQMYGRPSPGGKHHKSVVNADTWRQRVGQMCRHRPMGRSVDRLRSAYDDWLTDWHTCSRSADTHNYFLINWFEYLLVKFPKICMSIELSAYWLVTSSTDRPTLLHLLINYAATEWLAIRLAGR